MWDAIANCLQILCLLEAKHTRFGQTLSVQLCFSFCVSAVDTDHHWMKPLMYILQLGTHPTAGASQTENMFVALTDPIIGSFRKGPLSQGGRVLREDQTAGEGLNRPSGLPKKAPKLLVLPCCQHHILLQKKKTGHRKHQHKLGESRPQSNVLIISTVYHCTVTYKH